MPTQVNRVTRSFVASSSGSFFVLHSGTSGNYQLIMLTDENEAILHPALDSSLQTTNNLLSGLNEISVAQSGIFSIGQSGTWTFNPGQNITGTLVNGTIVGISGGTFLTGTNTVGFNNQSIQAGQSGQWDIRNINYISGGQIGITGTVSLAGTISVDQVGLTGGNLQVGQSGIWTVNIGQNVTGIINNNPLVTANLGSNITGNVSLNNGGAVTITGAPDIRITGSVVLQTGVVQVNINNSPTVSLSTPQVGLTGTTGLGLQIIAVSGYNSIPVWIPSGVIIENAITLKTGIISASITNTTVPVYQTNNITGALVAGTIVGISGGTFLSGTANVVTLNTGSVNINGSVTANLGTNSQVGITGQTLVQIVNSGAVPISITGNPLISVNANSNFTGSLVAGTQVGLSGDSVVILKSGVLSTDLNYVFAKSYRNVNITTGHFEIKTISGNLTDIHVFNSGAQTAFLSFFDEPTG